MQLQLTWTTARAKISFTDCFSEEYGAIPAIAAWFGPASIRHKEGNCEQQEEYQRVENPESDLQLVGER